MRGRASLSMQVGDGKEQQYNERAKQPRTIPLGEELRSDNV